MPDSPAHHVRRWRQAVGQPCADTPTVWVESDDLNLAHKLIREESRELSGALRFIEWCDQYRHIVENDALESIAQEAADLIWVTYGLCELLGIDLDRAISEVAAANMRKVQGGVRRRADGKILKPDGWVGPDMHAVIEQTRALGRQT
jgi:NTP pyrophosphatase (non-canonical NTP hydrolase)